MRTIDQLVAYAKEMKQDARLHSRTSSRAGCFGRRWSWNITALADAVGADGGVGKDTDRVRFDPNGTQSVEQAIRFGQAIEDLNNDYFEDPVYGLAGMRRLREFVRIPTATNTVVVDFEQLAANVLDTAVDVDAAGYDVLGRHPACIKAAGVCETMKLGVAVHSSGELGIQLATMLHLGAVIPNLSFAADAHYHHLMDDIIVGGKMKYEGGAIKVPDGPGLGRHAGSGQAESICRAV